MKKWLLRILYVCIALAPAAVWADYTATQGAGSTVFAFVCSSTKICPATVLIDSTNVEKATAGNPLRVDPTGTTTQPVSSTTLATKANQDTNAATTAHTCSIAGFSIIGCLGQIDDDVKGAISAGTNIIGFTTNDPCSGAATKVYTPINTVTANNTIIAGVAAKKKYICSIFIYPGATVNFAVYQATTGTSCATALSAIFGGTTTATGFLATATAGFAVGNGAAAIAATNTVNTDICITNGGTVQLSGAVVTVDQ